MRLLRVSALTLAMSAFTVTPALPQRAEVTRDELSRLETERDAALAQLQALEAAETAVRRDLGDLEAELISAAMESQRREEQATASELKLVSLSARLGSARRELVEGEEALQGLVASLAVSGRHRPPALVTSPGNANAAIRAAILMGDATPRVQARTDALAEEIADLRRLERQIKRERARLEAAEATLALKEAEILQMTAAKRAAFEDVSGDAKSLRDRAVLLGREADTIRDLLAAIERDAPSTPGLKPNLQLAARTTTRTDAPRRLPSAATPRPSRDLSSNLLGGLSRPAAGRLIRGWGDKTVGGGKSESLVIATRSGAQVTAPIDGSVVYADAFRTYGQLLIVETSDGYHILLSGMAESYVTVGQSVKRGEPVARMANRAMPEPELSLEVRKDGKPMNPARWMKGG
ncbi:peptidoglycan DD-metalloendopeptidase family protein [Hyphomonas sp. FCG-A18]|uniref:murein hydrolase activator EnvC family protein n=1 Tax=Hyphomonas sp. FCG-A18 TaxID=3080019 RepID=UPI002B2FCAF7|nr:peptidoglycan DD-metalloendopeptidase family protein [Hyphomonas sp. FCG-A18]